MMMLGDALRRLASGTVQYLRFKASSAARQDATAASADGTPVAPLKLDLGCGSAKVPGFLGIDRRSFDGVDGVTDLTKPRWIFKKPTLGGLRLIPSAISGEQGYVLPDNCVGEVRCSHFLEHLEHNQSKPERVRFLNELWRVMVPGGTASIITPYWASSLAFGDFTHADKPVAEFFYYYLDKDWRRQHAPDNDVKYNPDGYFCDFSSSLGHRLHPDFATKSVEERNHAISWYKDAVLELHALLVCRK